MNAIRPTRMVTPLMQQQGGGAIINISTFAAFEPDPLFPTSGVFRAALAAFTKLYADRYAADNIRVNNVLPGFIDSLPETEDRKARIPLGRYGYTAEVSSLISWLASQEGGYMTGQNLRIDGGLTRSVLIRVIRSGQHRSLLPIAAVPLQPCAMWDLRWSMNRRSGIIARYSPWKIDVNPRRGPKVIFQDRHKAPLKQSALPRSPGRYRPAPAPCAPGSTGSRQGIGDQIALHLDRIGPVR